MVNRVELFAGERYKFITLTLRSQADLRLMAEHLVKSFRKLRQTKYFKSRISGGAFVIEFKPSKTLEGYWHAHIHILAAGKFIDAQKLSEAWYRCTGGSYIVDIKAVGKTEVLNYLTKYATKAAEMKPEQRPLAAAAMKGLRMFQPFYRWFKLALGCPKHKSKCPECKNTGWLFLEDFMFDDHSYVPPRGPPNETAPLSQGC